MKYRQTTKCRLITSPSSSEPRRRKAPDELERGAESRTESSDRLPNHFNRTGRVKCYGFGHATYHQSIEPPPSMRTYNDQVCAPLYGFVQNNRFRIAQERRAAFHSSKASLPQELVSFRDGFRSPEARISLNLFCWQN